MIERVTVSEHYLAVEYVPVRPPERRVKSARQGAGDGGVDTDRSRMEQSEAGPTISSQQSG